MLFSETLHAFLMLTHPRLHLCHALALPVYSSTFITEVLATSTRHMVTALSPFDPKVAVWTLLELFAFNEFQERLVTRAYIGRDLVFFAGLTAVVLYTTVEAVVLRASGTGKLGLSLLLFWIVDKREPAVSSRAPGDVLLHFYSLIERKATVLAVLLIV